MFKRSVGKMVAVGLAIAGVAAVPVGASAQRWGGGGWHGGYHGGYYHGGVGARLRQHRGQRLSDDTPCAARRSANGSRDPVGFSPIEKKATSASILSARAATTLSGAVGLESFGPSGL